MKRKINILGTEYDVIIKSLKKDPKLEGLDGYIDYSIKTIVINEAVFKRDDPKLVEKLEEPINNILRHELVHGFIHESGLDCNYNTEVLVEWIARMLPKMYTASKEVVFTKKDIIERN